MTPTDARAAVISSALRHIIEPGTVVELRALGAVTPTYRRSHTLSGYFNDVDALARSAAQIGQAQGVYFTLNPVSPALLARAVNRVRDAGDGAESTSDADIIRRRWLPIDVDPKRPAGISSSDEEHEAALNRVRELRATLRAEGWPEPILADSGNGGHLLYRVDLPPDDGGLIRRVLQALAFRFDDSAIQIDQAVFNPARIWKLYGTAARKGDNASVVGRPHRESRLLDVPTALTPVPRGFLEALAASLPAEPKATGPQVKINRGDGFDLDRWITDHDLDVRGPLPWQGGRRWVFGVCPWNSDHRNRSAFILQFPSGAIAAGCRHNGCSSYDWHALRDVVEPGWREERRNGTGPAVGTTTPGGEHDSWDQPIPLLAYVLPEFPIQTLPAWMGDFVLAEAEATQTPVDLAAMLSLAVLAAAVAKKVVIVVMAGWVEPTNLYIVEVLPSGHRKTTVLQHVVSPLEAFERQENERVGPEIARQQESVKLLESRLQSARVRAAKAEGADAATMADEAKALAVELATTTVPALPRLVVDDVTPERLAGLLREHGGRIAAFAAEGDVFDLMAARYGNSPNFGVYLRAHAGDTLRVDRVGRPPEFVPAPALTMGLAVQPDVIRGLAECKTLRGRGLLARFLYSLPPSLLGRRRVGTTPVSQHVRGEYERNVLNLLRMPFNSDLRGEHVPHVLTLSDGARKLVLEFAGWIEPQLAEFGELCTMSDWAGKLAGAVARIAALLHVADQATKDQPWAGEVPEAIVKRAITIGQYLIPHARAAFSEMGRDETIEDAKHVLAWLAKSGAITFTKRDAFRACQGRFTEADLMDKPLNLLCSHGYIREQQPEDRPGPGRKPSPTYDVNPLWTPSAEDSVNCGNSVKGSGTPETEGDTEDVWGERGNGTSDTDTIDTIDRMRVGANSTEDFEEGEA